MASPDIDESGTDRDTQASQLPPGAHAQMSIGRMTDMSAGQPVPVDGTSSIDADPTETREWLDSLRYVLNSRGEERAAPPRHRAGGVQPRGFDSVLGDDSVHQHYPGRQAAALPGGP